MAGKLIKGNKKTFTTIDNSIFMDKQLSYKEIGLLCQLLSLPDNWNFNVAGLVTLHADGKSAIKDGLIALEKYGYLTRKQTRGADGKLGNNDYYIYDNPLDNPDYPPLTENRLTVEKPSPLTENPPTENPPAENPPLYNKYLINNVLNENLDSNIDDNSSFLFDYNPNELVEIAPKLFVKEEWCRDVESLIVAVGTHEIDSTKENLFKYLYTLQERGWLDSKGNPIESLYGYVKSNFSIKQKNKLDTDEISDEEEDHLPVYDTSKNRHISDEEIERLLALRKVKPNELSH